MTLSYRRDGSSRFEKESRWGNFPSAAFAWKVKEDFFKDETTLDFNNASHVNQQPLTIKIQRQ